MAVGATRNCAGDTLFALGCGRVFEGTMEQMWTSLSKLLPLPDDTRVYCAHEYTQSNARFAVTVDPGNSALKQRKLDIDAARQQVCMGHCSISTCGWVLRIA
jgi:hydroxyacylglutathione hydrolase